MILNSLFQRPLRQSSSLHFLLLLWVFHIINPFGRRVAAFYLQNNRTVNIEKTTLPDALNGRKKPHLYFYRFIYKSNFEPIGFSEKNFEGNFVVCPILRHSDDFF